MSLTGSVLNYDRKRGFGFIKPSDGGKGIFVHWTKVNSSDAWPSLKKGMDVTYDTEVDPERKGEQKEVATNVSGSDGEAVQMDLEREPDEVSKFTVNGTVKFFARKGFGFITTDTAIKFPKQIPAGTEVYVSREDLVVEDGGVCTLMRDQRVAFKVCKREGRDAILAKEVTSEDGSAISIAPGERPPPPSEGSKITKPGGAKGSAAKGATKGKSGGKAVIQTKVQPKGVQSAKIQIKPVVPAKGGGKSVIKTIAKTTITPATAGKGKGGIVKGGKGKKGLW